MRKSTMMNRLCRLDSCKIVQYDLLLFIPKKAKGICRDITDVGNWGNGDVEIRIEVWINLMK